MKFVLAFVAAASAAKLAKDAECAAGAKEEDKMCDDTAKLTCLATTVDKGTKSAFACKDIALCTKAPDEKTVVDCPDVKKEETKSGSVMLQLSAVAAAVSLYTMY